MPQDGHGYSTYYDQRDIASVHARPRPRAHLRRLTLGDMPDVFGTDAGQLDPTNAETNPNAPAYDYSTVDPGALDQTNAENPPLNMTNPDQPPGEDPSAWGPANGVDLREDVDPAAGGTPGYRPDDTPMPEINYDPANPDSPLPLPPPPPNPDYHPPGVIIIPNPKPNPNPPLILPPGGTIPPGVLPPHVQPSVNPHLPDLPPNVHPVPTPAPAGQPETLSAMPFIYVGAGIAAFLVAKHFRFI